MNNEEPVCRCCAVKTAPGKLRSHPVRSGYSAKHFPFFHYEKIDLCEKCLQRRLKLDLVEKGLAVLALAVIAYFMVTGIFLLFRAGP